MDPGYCSCQSGKCRAHLCLQRQRAFLRQNCPVALNRKLKATTKVIADSNGRFLNPQDKCSFPWSNYLMQQWICSCSSNSCGMKHIPSNTKNLPRFYKNLDPQSEDSLLHCDQEGRALWKSGGQNKTSNVTTADHLICDGFKHLKDKRLPVIWVYGYAHKPVERTRHQFCTELASELGFLYLNMDHQIRHWTDELFKRSSTEEVLILPSAVKRLATMCVQLMGDEELHLNHAGIIELLKLVMLNSWMEADTNRKPPKGFIISDFPCTRREAEAFEKSFYPMSLGLYFECRWWSDVDQKMLDPEVQCPIYFRRDISYSETQVEEVVDSWKDKSVKILNTEDFADFEAMHLTSVIKKKLAIVGGNNNTNSSATTASNNDLVNSVMQQLAPLYHCPNPNCKCTGNTQTNQGQVELGRHGGVEGSSAGGPITIVCPLERPPRPKTAKDEKSTKIEISVQEAPAISSTTSHPEELAIKEPSPTNSNPTKDNTGTTSPIVTPRSSADSQKKKGSKKSKKQGSKDKKKGGGEDGTASPKSKGITKNKKSKEIETSPSSTTIEQEKNGKGKKKGKPSKPPSASPAPSSPEKSTKKKGKTKESKPPSPVSSSSDNTRKKIKKNETLKSQPSAPSSPGAASKKKQITAESKLPSSSVPSSPEKMPKKKGKKSGSQSPSSSPVPPSPTKNSGKKDKGIKQQSKSPSNVPSSPEPQNKGLIKKKDKKTKSKSPSPVPSSPALKKQKPTNSKPQSSADINMTGPIRKRKGPKPKTIPMTIEGEE